MIERLGKVTKRWSYPLEVMLICVCSYLAYLLSLRYIEDVMRERSLFVDYDTAHSWAIKIVPVLGTEIHINWIGYSHACLLSRTNCR